MKCLALLFTLSIGGAAWAQQNASSSSLTHAPPPHPAHPNALPASSNAVMVTPQEQEELRVARSKVLQANLELVAENDKLSKRMRSFEEKLDAAMVKTDPTVAPLLAKLQAARAHSAAMSPPPVVSLPSTPQPPAK